MILYNPVGSGIGGNTSVPYWVKMLATFYMLGGASAGNAPSSSKKGSKLSPGVTVQRVLPTIAPMLRKPCGIVNVGRNAMFTNVRLNGLRQPFA